MQAQHVNAQVFLVTSTGMHFFFVVGVGIMDIMTCDIKTAHF